MIGVAMLQCKEISGFDQGLHLIKLLSEGPLVNHHGASFEAFARTVNFEKYIVMAAIGFLLKLPYLIFSRMGG